tara:strand:+ start:82 stop:279 length:198 start_codon:yes stop_codon:yes gene_type:complete
MTPISGRSKVNISQRSVAARQSEIKKLENKSPIRKNKDLCVSINKITELSVQKETDRQVDISGHN